MRSASGLFTYSSTEISFPSARLGGKGFHPLRARPSALGRLFVQVGPRDPMGRAARKWQLRRCI
jgi:hypothetical protein